MTDSNPLGEVYALVNNFSSRLIKFVWRENIDAPDR